MRARDSAASRSRSAAGTAAVSAPSSKIARASSTEAAASRSSAAWRSDTATFPGRGVRSQRRENRPLKFRNAFARHGAHAERGVRFRAGRGTQIRFRLYKERPRPVRPRDRSIVRRFVRGTEREDEVRAGGEVAGALDALALDGGAGLAQAGGVDEADGNAAEEERLLERVARGAGLGRDDGAALAEQAVEERGLAGVGRAGKDDERALAQEASRARGRGEIAERAGNRGGALVEADRRGEALGLLVREVERRLEVGAEREEILPDRVDAPSERAGELFGRGTRGAVALRGHEVHHRLGAVERDAAVQERAARELAGTGGRGAEGEKGVEDAGRRRAAAVRLELDDVLARVAVWRAEDEDERLVDRGTVAGVAQAHEPERAGGERRGRNLRAGAELVRDRERSLAGNPHHGDSGGAGRRRERGDGPPPFPWAFAFHIGALYHTLPAGAIAPPAPPAPGGASSPGKPQHGRRASPDGFVLQFHRA